MPRKPRVPSYSLHKPSGRAVVKVNQRSIYLGPYGSDESREAYARIIADLMASRPITSPSPPKQGTPTLVRSITVAEVATRYVAHAELYYRKNGKLTSEYHIVRRAAEFLKAGHSQLPASEFSIGDLKVVRQAIVDTGVARVVVNQYVSRIKRIFTWSATEELLPPSVPHALSLLPGLRAGRTTAKEMAPVKAVDPSLVETTLNHAPAVVADMVRLQLLTGMRPEEVCSMRPSDIDRGGDVWKYKVRDHKTDHHGKERIVYIGPGGQSILAPYLFREGEEFCFRPARHVAIPKRFKRYRTDSYRRAITRACVLAFPAPKGSSGAALMTWRKQHSWSPNQLRHTAATLIRKKYGLEAAQVLLGHSKANTTQIYAERDAAKGIEVARQIG